MSAVASAHWPARRPTGLTERFAMALSALKHAASATSAVAAYGQPTAQPAMTCEAGTRPIRIATHRAALDVQPSARKPRNITSDREPRSTEASSRIHPRSCTLVVAP